MYSHTQILTQTHTYTRTIRNYSHETETPLAQVSSTTADRLTFHTSVKNRPKCVSQRRKKIRVEMSLDNRQTFRPSSFPSGAHTITLTSGGLARRAANRVSQRRHVDRTSAPRAAGTQHNSLLFRSVRPLDTRRLPTVRPAVSRPHASLQTSPRCLRILLVPTQGHRTEYRNTHTCTRHRSSRMPDGPCVPVSAMEHSFLP